jgi:hypothetical protein
MPNMGQNDQHCNKISGPLTGTSPILAGRSVLVIERVSVMPCFMLLPASLDLASVMKAHVDMLGVAGAGTCVGVRTMRDERLRKKLPILRNRKAETSWRMFSGRVLVAGLITGCSRSATSSGWTDGSSFVAF